MVLRTVSGYGRAWVRVWRPTGRRIATVTGRGSSRGMDLGGRCAVGHTVSHYGLGMREWRMVLGAGPIAARPVYARPWWRSSAVPTFSWRYRAAT
jgi:hypothetical protein